MKDFALVNTQSNLVENTIFWDGTTEYSPPDGFMLIELSEENLAGVGWSYIDGVFVEPPSAEISTYSSPSTVAIGGAPNVIVD